MSRKNRSLRRSASAAQKMPVAAATAAPKQVGGAPGSIASSPLIPPINLKSFTDLFTGKTNFFTLQSPAKNIMNSPVLTAAHNFFHNLNTKVIEECLILCTSLGIRPKTVD